jgi:hypothetical protein
MAACAFWAGKGFIIRQPADSTSDDRDIHPYDAVTTAPSKSQEKNGRALRPAV